MGFAEAKAELWTSAGFPAVACETVEEAERFIAGGVGDISIVVLHKDLGDSSKEPNGAQRILAALAQNRANVRIRKGYISGEYPDGKYHALEDGMDFYMPTTIDALDPWLLEQFSKGYVIDDSEYLLRHREVAMPPGDFGPPERQSLGFLL